MRFDLRLRFAARFLGMAFALLRQHSAENAGDDRRATHQRAFHGLPWTGRENTSIASPRGVFNVCRPVAATATYCTPSIS